MVEADSDLIAEVGAGSAVEWIPLKVADMSIPEEGVASVAGRRAVCPNNTTGHGDDPWLIRLAFPNQAVREIQFAIGRPHPARDAQRGRLGAV